ncbi:hypothetical protein NC652_014986 [Populus alba x Populus x berolinensis]|nr:hypothetical protein NC652_014986 [Populus alba x Populus x berolinensis]
MIYVDLMTEVNQRPNDTGPKRDETSPSKMVSAKMMRVCLTTR